MNKGNIIYRQKQKWKYLTAKDSFERYVAELNRNHEQIRLQDQHFQVIGCDLNFHRKQHQFVVYQLNLFNALCMLPGGHFDIADGYLYYRISRLNLRVTTTEELFILHEIFAEKCYNLIVPEEQYIVVDIGMNVGFASLYFASIPQVTRVFSFEPFKPTFEDALVNLSLNPSISDKIQPHNIGLGSQNKSLIVGYSSSNKGQNSIYNSEGKDVENITIRSAREILKELIEQFPGSNFYIKLDTEGAEYEIFDSLFNGNDLFSRVKGFMIEWHEKGPISLEENLTRTGFKMISSNLGSKTGIIYAFR